MTVGTTFLVVGTLIQKALVTLLTTYYLLLTTRITPSFPPKENSFKDMMKSQPRIIF